MVLRATTMARLAIWIGVSTGLTNLVLDIPMVEGTSQIHKDNFCYHQAVTVLGAKTNKKQIHKMPKWPQLLINQSINELINQSIKTTM